MICEQLMLLLSSHFFLSFGWISKTEENVDSFPYTPEVYISGFDKNRIRLHFVIRNWRHSTLRVITMALAKRTHTHSPDKL